MKYEITCSDSDRLFIVKTEGQMNANDFIAMGKDLLKHPRFRANGNAIFNHVDLDFSAATLVDLEKIRAFHMKNEERIGHGKSAMVVKVGMISAWNRLWSQGEKIKSGNKVKIFEDYNSALKWIADIK